MAVRKIALDDSAGTEGVVVKQAIQPAVNLGNNSAAMPVANVVAVDQTKYQNVLDSAPVNDQNAIGNFFAGVVNAIVPGANLGDSNSTFKDFGHDVGIPLVAAIAVPAIIGAVTPGAAAAATAATDLTPEAVTAASVAAAPAAAAPVVSAPAIVAGAGAVGKIVEVAKPVVEVAKATQNNMSFFDTILNVAKDANTIAGSVTNTISKLNAQFGLPDKTTNPLVLGSANISTASDQLGKTGGQQLNNASVMPVVNQSQSAGGTSPLVIGGFILLAIVVLKKLLA